MRRVLRLLAAALLAGPAGAALAEIPARASVPARSVETEALLSAGVAAFRKGDHVAARRLFRELAQRQVPAAETLLGTMAANGQGGPKDEAVAAAWFLRAANRGFAPAQLALADAFGRGRGVPKDKARAVALARAAAVQGQPGAAQLIARHSAPQLAMVEPYRP
jgi:TPR repeat protein